MEALRASSVQSLYIPNALHKTHLITKPNFINFQSSSILIPTSWSFSSRSFKVFTTSSSYTIISTENTDPKLLENETPDEKFDWYSSSWCPVIPVCDLDKRVPHGKKVLGLDIVVWWDKNDSSWKVFDDACPHRLAPLSDGRIDKWGRLQCAYHGWCFNGSGDCKLIPQAAPDGPPVNTFKKACVAIYPSTVQHDILWFWPNTDPKYKDIIQKKKPPYLPELDDPSSAKLMGMKVDREGGKPLEMSVTKLDVNGFIGKADWGGSKFIAPFIYQNSINPVVGQRNESESTAGIKKERKIMSVGPVNWQKACFVPTKADAFVVGFRRWLRKYSGGQINWGGKFSEILPPTPPREQLMDRYWSHVVNCRSCNSAYKSLNAVEVILQIISIVSIGIVAATKQSVMSAAARTMVVLMAVVCFATSRWLAHFIYKNFHYHDYNHASR
ncbi:hypothetical protein LWI28_000915 [Acer negundo]|uniref:Rieske domain-containing protein n=1 Tax=Acer negundo TaxID=4023 RepID=A0AAD5NVE6_ACENE|nr:hypothetical protein LWI28_000915 [Acer negundo]